MHRGTRRHGKSFRAAHWLCDTDHHFKFGHRRIQLGPPWVGTGGYRRLGYRQAETKRPPTEAASRIRRKNRVTKGIRQANLLDIPDPVSIGQRPSCFFAGAILPASQPAEVSANFSDTGILVSLFTGYLFKPGSRNAKAPCGLFHCRPQTQVVSSTRILGSPDDCRGHFLDRRHCRNPKAWQGLRQIRRCPLWAVSEPVMR